jgi:DNA polymerase-3 subunit delta'
VSWAAIIGQSLAVRLLRRAILTGKVAHAYLFAGPDGVGKRTVALELAKALQCRQREADGSACDQCTACRRLSADPPHHPDVILIQPDGRWIKTDQMRAVQAEMYARPSEGLVRIAVIDGADRMNAEAGNRLLKLLEEPPAHAVLILLAENLAGVLPTLVSRCQVVNFPPLSPDQVQEALERVAGMPPAQARLFASLSGGSIGRAMAMAQDAAVAERRDRAYDFLQKLPQMDDFAILGYAEGLDKEKEKAPLDNWLDMLTIWLRDALVLTQTGSDRLVINADRLPAVRTLADRYGAAALLAMLSAVTEARNHLQRNANVRLSLDVLCLRLAGHAAPQRVGAPW